MSLAKSPANSRQRVDSPSNSKTKLPWSKQISNADASACASECPLDRSYSGAAEAAYPAADVEHYVPSSIWLLGILSTLMGFASISTDLYLPALPTIARELHTSAGTMELTISTYLIGFSLGQLLWGPIGDRFGRRGPVALGLGLFILGSMGCALSTAAWQMIACRIVQASGACAGVVIGRAMVRDLYEHTRAAQMLSTLMTVMAIAPLLGPVLGSEILRHGSWQAIFWTLVGIGTATLIAVYTIPETLPTHRRQPHRIHRAMAGYVHLLREPRLLSHAGVSAFYYAGMFAYIAGTPFAYMEYYHISAQAYGWLFSAGVVGIMIANMVNARLVPTLGIARLMAIGAVGGAVASVVLVANAVTGFGGLWGLVVPLLLFVAMVGLIVANSISGAMADFPERAGSVSALVGAMQYGSGIFGSALVGILADGTPRPMSYIIGISAIGSLLCAGYVLYAARLPASE
ncbi:Bicyclomycin resistance protein [Aeoliella mucimassa]|uniref:Bicyclomycin resistance protein n=2 Tax=Aeoliella mucimassa TaxID=2527972 RepID=A0A518AQC1_9BACT|nr:Bicyclomycin resistance protein [Aeoliella mucimassa]